MNIEELQAIFYLLEWDYLGNGTYNCVYVSRGPLTINGYTGRWVLKQPIHKNPLDEDLSTWNNSGRAVRKWNLINPTFPAYQVKEGWIAPYLGNELATDEQRMKHVLRVYRTTRNIIIDAINKTNFLVFQGNVICIDVDLARRRGSLSSDEFKVHSTSKFSAWINKYSGLSPQTASVIKTLLFLEKNLAEEQIKDEYLTLSLITTWHTLRYNKAIPTTYIMDVLANLRTKSILGTFLRTNPTLLQNFPRITERQQQELSRAQWQHELQELQHLSPMYLTSEQKDRIRELTSLIEWTSFISSESNAYLLMGQRMANEMIDIRERIEVWVEYLEKAFLFEKKPLYFLMDRNIPLGSSEQFAGLLLYLLDTRGLSAETILNSGLLHRYFLLNRDSLAIVAKAYHCLYVILPLCGEEARHQLTMLLHLVRTTGYSAPDGTVPSEFEPYTLHGFASQGALSYCVYNELSPDATSYHSINLLFLYQYFGYPVLVRKVVSEQAITNAIHSLIRKMEPSEALAFCLLLRTELKENHWHDIFNSLVALFLSNESQIRILIKNPQLAWGVIYAFTHHKNLSNWLTVVTSERLYKLIELLAYSNVRDVIAVCKSTSFNYHMDHIIPAIYRKAFDLLLSNDGAIREAFRPFISCLRNYREIDYWTASINQDLQKTLTAVIIDHTTRPTFTYQNYADISNFYHTNIHKVEVLRALDTKVEYPNNSETLQASIIDALFENNQIAHFSQCFTLFQLDAKQQETLHRTLYHLLPKLHHVELKKQIILSFIEEHTIDNTLLDLSNFFIHYSLGDIALFFQLLPSRVTTIKLNNNQFHQYYPEELTGLMSHLVHIEQLSLDNMDYISPSQWPHTITGIFSEARISTYLTKEETTELMILTLEMLQGSLANLAQKKYLLKIFRVAQQEQWTYSTLAQLLTNEKMAFANDFGRTPNTPFGLRLLDIATFTPEMMMAYRSQSPESAKHSPVKINKTPLSSHAIDSLLKGVHRQFSREFNVYFFKQVGVSNGDFPPLEDLARMGLPPY